MAKAKKVNAKPNGKSKPKVEPKIAVKGKGPVKVPVAIIEKFRAGSIGRQTVEGISAGMSNDEILAAVKKVHKDADTTVACVSWYRSKLNKLMT